MAAFKKDPWFYLATALAAIAIVTFAIAGTFIATQEQTENLLAATSVAVIMYALGCMTADQKAQRWMFRIAVCMFILAIGFAAAVAL